MKQPHVLTKQIKKEISKLVRVLPPMMSKTLKVKKQIFGHQLIEGGLDKDNNGNAINPKKNYVVDIPAPINHKTEAERNFKIHGMPGVHGYVEQAWDVLKTQLEENPAPQPENNE